MKNLLLYGLPFSGKSIVGRMLAETFDREFIDTDLEIEKRYGLSCRQLFRARGEPAFRQLERELLKYLSEKVHCVIALGGGTLTDPENQKIAKELGDLIYLKCGTSELKKRIGSQKELPAYLDGIDFESLEKNRALLYETIADFVVETSDMSASLVAEKIGETVGKQFLGTTF
jgi:shikimate kinase